jgi:hypothetical protein
MKYGNITINIYIDGVDVESEVNNECPTEGEDLLINLKKGVEDYWSEAVDAVAKEVTEPEFSVGDRVGMLSESNKVPVGSVGRVVEVEPRLVLVAWDSWTKGHDNNGGSGNMRWELPEDIEKLTLKEGALVVFTGSDSDEDTKGFAGISLIGKIGEVVLFDEDSVAVDAKGNSEFGTSYLVEFKGWNDGHDGDYDDGAKSRWWVTKNQLEVIG